LYGQGSRSALEIAQIGQKAENDYFGKPCGLMDQVACASGGVVAIDFAYKDAPKVSTVSFDPISHGYALCVVNTRGNHADLTPDYAAIPAEMQEVAGFFGKSVLREIDRDAVLQGITELRKACGDRAVLRTLHFFDENDRVDAMLKALESLNAAHTQAEQQAALTTYLGLVDESGNSSWELLQNIYSAQNPQEQGISLALALTRKFGVCRVHGGGFAGTIQAYIPLDAFDSYKAAMEAVFGNGAVTALQIRPAGVAELDF
jgi:galactokinase